MIYIKELNLKHFVKKYKASFSNNRINATDLEEIEKLINFKFGKQLRTYILKYVFLSFEYLEFYGITTDLGRKSDMIVKTIQLNKDFPKTQKTVVFENFGDGVYILVDEDDRIYSFDIDSNILYSENVSLNNYVCERFKTVKRMLSGL